ncbi:MAG: hypothetical protein R2784_05550 [Saprospiraceae bacterium]
MVIFNLIGRPTGSTINQTPGGAEVILPGYYLLNIVNLDNGCSDTSGIQICRHLRGLLLILAFWIPSLAQSQL